jgi:hypothetical protein
MVGGSESRDISVMAPLHQGPASPEALGNEAGASSTDDAASDTGVEIARLRAEAAEARAAVAVLTKQLADLRRAVGPRLERLEQLTDHRDLAATSMPRPAFASPAVTVVMPTWNRAGLIGAAIRSVQAQTFADWELQVVDDGSSDDTAVTMAAFQADPRIVYTTAGHCGRSAARNRALRQAKGELVAYLDSDNLWFPEFLSAAVAALADRREVDCVYGAMVRNSDPKKPRILFERFDRERLLRTNFIDLNTLVHRRGLVDRYGGFDESLDALEDWDLVLRYTAHAPAFRLPVRAVRYRLIDGSRAGAPRSREAARIAIRRKWGLE